MTGQFRCELVPWRRVARLAQDYRIRVPRQTLEDVPAPMTKEARRDQ